MRQKGIWQALLSGICFGFLGLFGKGAYTKGMLPGEFLSLRFLTASLLLGGWFLVVSPIRLRADRTTLLRCLALGVGGYALFSSFFFFALQGLSASLTVLLLYTYPVIVSLGAWRLFGEPLSRLEWIALPVVSLGMGLLVWGELEVRAPSALLLGFLAALFYSLYILASSRWLKGSHPATSVFYIMLFAGIALGLLHLRPSSVPAALSAWPQLGGAALVSSVFAMGLFLAALQKLRNSEISLLSLAEPVTGVAAAAFFLGERLHLAQATGGIMILSGMFLVALAQRKPKILEKSA